MPTNDASSDIAQSTGPESLVDEGPQPNKRFGGLRVLANRFGSPVLDLCDVVCAAYAPLHDAPRKFGDMPSTPAGLFTSGHGPP